MSTGSNIAPNFTSLYKALVIITDADFDLVSILIKNEKHERAVDVRANESDGKV